jgi:hypothetical protein
MDLRLLALGFAIGEYEEYSGKPKFMWSVTGCENRYDSMVEYSPSDFIEEPLAEDMPKLTLWLIENLDASRSPAFEESFAGR